MMSRNVCVFMLTMMTLLELVMTLLELRSSKKWMVTRKTIEGWISQYNRVSNDAMPGFLMQGDGKCVAKVRCKVCCEFREQSISSWNYWPKFIERTSNVRSRLTVVSREAKKKQHARPLQ